jgi:hypothetical protein
VTSRKLKLPARTSEVADFDPSVAQQKIAAAKISVNNFLMLEVRDAADNVWRESEK